MADIELADMIATGILSVLANSCPSDEYVPCITHGALKAIAEREIATFGKVEAVLNHPLSTGRSADND